MVADASPVRSALMYASTALMRVFILVRTSYVCHWKGIWREEGLGEAKTHVTATDCPVANGMHARRPLHAGGPQGSPEPDNFTRARCCGRSSQCSGNTSNP